MFYYIPNLTSQTAFPVAEPWVDNPAYPPHVEASVEAYLAWRIDSATQHRFYSGARGQHDNLRISGDNPPHALSALIVDYDGSTTDDYVATLHTLMFCDFPPAYFARSYNHCRLMWLFKAPVLLPPEPRALRACAEEFTKALQLGKWLGGFDCKAISAFGNYYDTREWKPIVPTSLIPAEFVANWIFQACKKISFVSSKDVVIPIPDIETAVRTRFPGRWPGPFELGSRGVRFWDPAADNPTAAIVREGGMQCWTGDRAFMSWREILGPSFIEQYEADKVGKVCATTAVDATGRYWMQQVDETWRDSDRSQFHILMRVHGFSQTRSAKETASEMDHLEAALLQRNRIEMAAPLAGQPPGYVTIEGKRYLNTRASIPLKASAPWAEGHVTWDEVAKKCPTIHGILDGMYNAGKPLHAEKQVGHFLAWLADSYQSMVMYKAHPGLIKVTCAPPDAGKTLSDQRIIGPLLGGVTSATAYVLGEQGSQWTQELAASPYWVIDDPTPPGTTRDHNRFTNRLKVIAANAKLSYSRKYHDSFELPWMGRVNANMNDDDESFRAMPNTDMSVKQKLLLCKCGKARIAHKSRETLERAIAEELPYFARFLLEYVIPDAFLEKRFVVASWAHPELMRAAFDSGDTAALNGVLVPWLETLQNSPDYRGKDRWTGTANDLFEVLKIVSPGIMSEFTLRALATTLGILSRNGLNIVKRHCDKTGLSKWDIKFDLGLVSRED